MVRKRLAHIVARLVQTSALAFFVALFGGVSAQAAGSIHVTGTVTNPSGAGVQNVTITATAPGSSTTQYGPVFTDATGSYQLDVDPGTYDFHFTPPAGSGLNPATTPNFTVFNDQVLNIQFTSVVQPPAMRTLSGFVTDSFGLPASATLTLYSDHATSYAAYTDGAGHYNITAPADQYSLTIAFGVRSLSSRGLVYDLRTADATQNIQLPDYATITVNVKDASNNAVSGADVYIYATGAFTIAPGVVFDGYDRKIQPTSGTGQVIFTTFRGFVVPVNNISVRYPNGTWRYNAAPVDTAGGDVAVTIAPPPVHTLSGFVTDQTGAPAPGVRVTLSSDHASSFTSTTDGLGGFSIEATPNMYALELASGSSWSLTSGLVYDLRTTDAIQSIQLPALASITVDVRDATDSPVAGAEVRATSATQEFTVAPGLTMTGYSRPYAYTQSTGQVTLTVLAGPQIPTGSLSARFPNETWVYNTAPIQTNAGDVQVTLRHNPPVTHSLSGTITDGNDMPAAGVKVELFSDHASVIEPVYTDQNGHYAITATPDQYDIQLTVPFDWHTVRLGTTGLPYDLRTADRTQDIKLPSNVMLRTYVKDSSGNPVEGAQISLTVDRAPIAVVAGQSFIASVTTTRTTAANGAASIALYQGMTIPAGYLRATYADNIVRSNATDLTLDADTTVVFQPAPEVPAAPSNLSAITPTNNAPALTWDPVSTAATYRVFRDGTQIATTSEPHHVDTILATSGQYTYTVQAVNANNVASPDSSPFVVLYDTLAPTLGLPTWSANPVLVTATSTTVTIPVTDQPGLSGVAAGEYYLDTDPGTGLATNLTYANGALSLTLDLNGTLPVGVYDIGFRARDAAGNWSQATKSMLVVYEPTTLGITGKNKKDLVPSLANGDILPGLIASGQLDTADYGFTVSYDGATLSARNDFHFSYATGTHCGKANAVNCHSFDLVATSTPTYSAFDWLLIDQAGDSRGRFQGMASLTIDGVTTTNPFTVEGIDGNRLPGSADDRITLKVYAPGANPATDSALYQVSGFVGKNNAVTIR